MNLISTLFFNIFYSTAHAFKSYLKDGGFEFTFYCFSGYTMFIWLGTFFNYEVVKFLIACFTALAVGVFGQAGKEIVFPIIRNYTKETITPFVKKKYNQWKKSKNS